jgi:hypothetical protein
MGNRNGLAVQTRLTQATETVEREAAAVAMITARLSSVTVGADKAYDTQASWRTCGRRKSPARSAENRLPRRPTI